jgi:uncharacterized protein (TIGR03435 family)
MKAFVLIVLAIAVVAIPMLCQAPAEGKAQFEVASVKVHPPPITMVGISNRGGRFIVTGFSLKMLVGRGYGVPDLKIVGAPAWADSERYDIEAKAPGDTAPGPVQPMIQALLADRFQLKVHKETRDLPVYELTVPKNGSKMKLSADQTPPAPLAGRGPGPEAGPGGIPGARGPLGPSPGGPGGGPGPFDAGPRPRGAMGFATNQGHFVFEGSAIPVSALVNALQQRVDRPIVDKTGLNGLFDIRLEWAPGAESPPLPFTQNPDAPPPPPVEGPSVFTAIQEQLGLKLESAKGPAEVIVIDSAQKPSEN